MNVVNVGTRTFEIQPPWPCALCDRRIFGAHWRVYPRPIGQGCDLVCRDCAKRRERLDEEWFEVLS